MKMIAKTHPGKVRDHNEDAFLCEPDQDLAVIADGMGGHAAGEVAAEITIDTCRELATKGSNLVATMMECHQRIIDHASEHPESRGMGCAVVAAQLSASEVIACWVGDSRAYLYNRESGLEAISRDHSYVQWLLINGQISEHQARIHPDRNLVMQCLGIKPPQPETRAVPWQFNDIVLLCSDGLTDEADDGEIAAILGQADNLESALDALMQAALDHGGKDNITIALIQNTAKPVQELAHEVATTRVKDKPWLAIAIGVGTALVIALGWYLFNL
jgi:protein phosphatase